VFQVDESKKIKKNSIYSYDEANEEVGKMQGKWEHGVEGCRRGLNEEKKSTSDFEPQIPLIARKEFANIENELDEISTR